MDTPGQSSPFKADWDSVGQCEMDWDNAYPLDLHGIGIPLGRLGQRGILGQSSILDNLQRRLRQCGLGQGWDNGYPLDIHGILGQSWILDTLQGRLDNVGSCLQGGLGQSANPWIPIGYPWHWHPWVPCRIDSSRDA